MTRFVLLDSGPTGLITNPRASLENARCNRWMQALLTAGAVVVLPEIVDYEVRSELLRADKKAGLGRLDGLKAVIHYAPLTTPIMVAAANLWAQARKGGMPTAHDKALDVDVILAAQAVALLGPGDAVVIATTNVGHLARFGPAQHWSDIL
jgi:predicted nucleic acid-binding protein